jgi:hypothetical protein
MNQTGSLWIQTAIDKSPWLQKGRIENSIKTWVSSEVPCNQQMSDVNNRLQSDRSIKRMIHPYPPIISVGLQLRHGHYSNLIQGAQVVTPTSQKVTPS